MATKEDILAYVNRDWKAIERMKERRWFSLSPSESLRMAEGLRQHALALHPDWPTETDRREDRLIHERVSESLSRASSGRRH